MVHIYLKYMIPIYYLTHELVKYVQQRNSLSARIFHRAPPPAPSGPKFSNSENCCGSENAMPPKIFCDMEGHRGHFR